VAANWLPLGARVRLEGMPGVLTVEDRMSRRHPSRVDVFFARHDDARQFGVRKLRLTVIGPARNNRRRQ
jgi:3D (Asp-Asp-Asp) domain-containing protein